MSLTSGWALQPDHARTTILAGFQTGEAPHGAWGLGPRSWGPSGFAVWQPGVRGETPEEEPSSLP